MKTLEQLGISPAPWRLDKWGELCDVGDVIGDYFSDVVIRHERRTKVIVTPNRHFDDWEANARLIAAAPKLYEAVYDLLEIVGNVSEYIEADCGTMAKVERARAALAEAAGEEVAK